MLRCRLCAARTSPAVSRHAFQAGRCQRSMRTESIVSHFARSLLQASEALPEIPLKAANRYSPNTRLTQSKSQDEFKRNRLRAQLLWRVRRLRVVARLVTVCLQPPPMKARSANRRPAVDHHLVQVLLRAFPVNQVAPLQHFTVVADHLRDVDRIVSAVFGTIFIDVA